MCVDGSRLPDRDGDRLYTDKSEPRVNSLFVSLRLALRRCFSVLRGHLSPRFLGTGLCIRLQTLRLNSRGSFLIVLSTARMSTVFVHRAHHEIAARCAHLQRPIEAAEGGRARLVRRGLGRAVIEEGAVLTIVLLC